MYEETAQQNTVAGLKSKVSPLQSALNSQAEQIDKLGGLLAQLEERLGTLRNSSPQAAGNENPDRAVCSPTVDQVRIQTESIQRLQSRLVGLLDELEV